MIILVVSVRTDDTADMEQELPYYREIHLYTVRLTGEWDQSDDIVQETYLRYVQNRKGLVPEMVRSWLYRTARNLFIDHYRRARRTTTVKETFKTDVLPARQAPDSIDPSDQAAQKELLSKVLEKVSNLPARQQEVVRLKFQEKLTYDQIAEVTGEPKTTVAWLLHEAMQKLRKELAPYQ